MKGERSTKQRHKHCRTNHINILYIFLILLQNIYKQRRQQEHTATAYERNCHNGLVNYEYTNHIQDINQCKNEKQLYLRTQHIYHFLSDIYPS